MKICVVVKNSIWFDPRVRKQIIEYKRSGFEVCGIGVKDNRYDEIQLEKLHNQITLVNLSLKRKRFQPAVFFQIIREISGNKQITRELIKYKPDVIHANDLNALIPCSKAAKKLNCKLIYDSHEIFLENPWINRSFLKKTVWGYFERKIINKANLVISVSNSAAAYLEKKYEIKNIIVVTNSVSRSLVVAKKEKSPNFEVLNHGQFYEGRGYDIMIKSAYLMDNKNIKFVIRGLGPLENELKLEAKRLKTNNLRFDPPVPVQDLISEASKSWVALAITENISQNFLLSVSNKLFEYAAAGLPVIMSDIPEHKILNEKYNFGLIIVDNHPQTINDAINVLYNNNLLYEELSQNAILMSLDSCWENEFSKITNIIKNGLI